MAVGLLDWLLGQAPEPLPIKPALPLDTDRTASPVSNRLERVREIPQSERGPAERLLPEHPNELWTTARDRKPEPLPEAPQVATQMQNTRTPQPAPSLGGSGTTWVNPRVRPSIWQPEIEAAEQKHAAAEAAMTPEQKAEREVQQILAQLERGGSRQ